MAKANVTVKQGSPPFMPPTMVQLPAAQLGGGGSTPYSGPMEDGPGAYLNYDGVSPISYAGQNQTATINIRIPKPV
jgi:hypothetical protein